MKPRFADTGFFIALLNAGDSLHREALRLHNDGTDRISCIVMQDMGLEEALTADHHFNQMGFAVLMQA